MRYLKILLFITCIVLVASLCGCAASFRPLPKRYCLSKKSVLALAKHEAVLFNIKYLADDKELTFRALLEPQDDRLVFVGFTPFGTRWFTLTQQDTHYTTELTPFPPIPIKPIEILGNYRLAFTTLNDLKQDCNRLYAANEIIEESNIRYIKKDEQELKRIEYRTNSSGKGGAIITDNMKSYRLVLQILDYY